MELLAKYNASVINYPPKELYEDIDNARRHSLCYKLLNSI